MCNIYNGGYAPYSRRFRVAKREPLVHYVYKVLSSKDEIKKPPRFWGVYYIKMEDMLLTVADFASRNANLQYTTCTRFYQARTR